MILMPTKKLQKQELYESWYYKNYDTNGEKESIGR